MGLAFLAQVVILLCTAGYIFFLSPFDLFDDQQAESEVDRMIKDRLTKL